MSNELIECLTKGNGRPLGHASSQKQDQTTFTVLEIRGDATTKQTSLHLLENTNLTQLKQAMANDDTSSVSVLVRLVYTPLIPTGTHEFDLALRQDCYDGLLQLFELTDIRELAHTSGMSFDIVPQLENDKVIGVRYSTFVSNHSGLYLNFNKSRHAHGVFWYYESTDNTRSSQVTGNIKMVIEKFSHLASDPYFVLFAWVVNLISSSDRRLGWIRGEVNAIEHRTGYQIWSEKGVVERLSGSLIEPHLPRYLAQLSGASSVLASDRRFIQMALEMINAIRGSVDLGDLVPETDLISQPKIKNDIEWMERKFKMNLVQVDVLEARVRSQLLAVQNLIARSEMKLSICIADDSKSLANSMKILAILTVLFLPATFMASLFSTSMFNWHPSEIDSVSPLFWIYWIVTVPLTAVTILAFRWLNRKWSKPMKWPSEVNV